MVIENLIFFKQILVKFVIKVYLLISEYSDFHLSLVYTCRFTFSFPMWNRIAFFPSNPFYSHACTTLLLYEHALSKFYFSFHIGLLLYQLFSFFNVVKFLRLMIAFHLLCLLPAVIQIHVIILCYINLQIRTYILFLILFIKVWT